MGYATLLVHVEADDDGKARVALAAGLARQMDAALVGVAARDIVPPLTASAAGPVIVAALLAVEKNGIQANLDAAEQHFWAVAGNDDKRTVWRSSIDNPAEALARESRAADLIIVGRRPEHASPSRHADPGDVLMRAGRPVLVVPPGLSHLDAASVVVAWTDSRESRRAVADALPLLRRAASVLVLEVCNTESEQADAAAAVEDVAGRLSRHGVRATAEARILREASVSAELLLAMEQHRAGLVVAGGYGHSRPQEWAFGGLTRTLLRQCPKCCLLSH